MQRAWTRNLRKQGWNPFHSTASRLLHTTKQTMSAQQPPSPSSTSSQQQTIPQQKTTVVGNTVKSLNMNNPPLNATPEQQAEYIKLVQQKEKNRTKLNWLLALGVSSVIGSVLLRNYWEDKIKEEEERKAEEAAQKLKLIALKKKQDEMDNLTKEEDEKIALFEQKLKQDEEVRSKYTPSEQQLEKSTAPQQQTVTVDEAIRNIVGQFSNVQVVSQEPVVVVPSAALSAEQVDSEELNALRSTNQKLESEIQRMTTLLQQNEQKIQQAIQEKISEIEGLHTKMEQQYKGREEGLLAQLEQERQKLVQAEQEMLKAKELFEVLYYPFLLFKRMFYNSILECFERTRRDTTKESTGYEREFRTRISKTSLNFIIFLNTLLTYCWTRI